MLKWYDKRNFVPKYDMIKDCYKIIETEFNKPIFLTKEDYKDFGNSTIKRWICKKEFEEGEVIVKDHDYITGKF